MLSRSLPPLDDAGARPTPTSDTLRPCTLLVPMGTQIDGGIPEGLSEGGFWARERAAIQ